MVTGQIMSFRRSVELVGRDSESTMQLSACPTHEFIIVPHRDTAFDNSILYLSTVRFHQPEANKIFTITLNMPNVAR